jgi:hypothetical protein
LPFRYDPAPTDAEGGFYLIDADTREIDRFVSPLDGGAVTFLEQGPPGILVGGGRLGGAYAESGFGCGLFLYDTTAHRTTHVIKMTGHFGYSTYAPKTQFERGPDHRVYFWIQKPPGMAQGAVLFRIDARDGNVEGVAKGPVLSHTGLFLNGPSLAFGPQRVYFACGARLMSASRKSIVGE